MNINIRYILTSAMTTVQTVTTDLIKDIKV